MMRLSLLIAPVLLLAPFVAGAQVYRGSYQSYADQGYSDRDMPRRDRAVFDQVRADLERASRYAYASKSDRRRFDEARRELFDFQARFDQGRYERHELDQAIDRMEKVVSHNSLDPRDRGALSDDIRKLRDYRSFRAHGDVYNSYRR
jgi:hypothetical protein